jgi:hypothetical protein
VTVWWRTAQDRDLWSKIIKKAKAHEGCSAKEEESRSLVALIIECTYKNEICLAIIRVQSQLEGGLITLVTFIYPSR